MWFFTLWAKIVNSGFEVWLQWESFILPWIRVFGRFFLAYSSCDSWIQDVSFSEGVGRGGMGRVVCIECCLDRNNLWRLICRDVFKLFHNFPATLVITYMGSSDIWIIIWYWLSDTLRASKMWIVCKINSFELSKLKLFWIFDLN